MPSRLHKAACPLPQQFPVSHRQGTQADRDRANSRHDRRLRSGRVEASGHVLRASAWVRTEILSLSKGLVGLRTVHPLPHRDRKRHRFSASTPMVRFAPLLPPSGEARHLPGARYRLWPPTAPPSVEKQPDATLKADASAFFTRVGRGPAWQLLKTGNANGRNAVCSNVRPVPGPERPGTSRLVLDPKRI